MAVIIAIENFDAQMYNLKNYIMNHVSRENCF